MVVQIRQDMSIITIATASMEMIGTAALQSWYRPKDPIGQADLKIQFIDHLHIHQHYLQPDRNRPVPVLAVGEGARFLWQPSNLVACVDIYGVFALLEEYGSTNV